MSKRTSPFLAWLNRSLAILPAGMFMCLGADVTGRPRWLAAYLQEGICRLKWVATIAIAGFVLEGYIFLKIRVPEFVPAAKSMGHVLEEVHVAQIMIVFTVATGIVSSIYLLFLLPRICSIATARVILLSCGLFMTMGEGLQIGLTHFGVTHLASFGIAILIVFSLAPLSTVSLIIILLLDILLIVSAALLTGHEMTGPEWASLTNPITVGALGMIINAWYRGSFKAQWLAERRLQHRMKQLELKNAQIETQKNKVETQRGELYRALSSALTAPVAKAYSEFGDFKSEFKTVCVIACDAVGFSDTCQKLQPNRVIMELEKFFYKFDAACLKYMIEPLRAQGDSRIAIAGLWSPNDDKLHHSAINSVLAMLAFRKCLPSTDAIASDAVGEVLWPARIGICIGSVACGVINTGRRPYDHGEEISVKDEPHAPGRLWFDVWGDTVNLAARLEQGAKTNQILVRESLLWETRGLFDYGPIHTIQVKATTLPDVSEIIGIRQAYCDNDGEPNEEFWRLYADASIGPYKPDRQGSAHRYQSVLG